MPLHSRFIGIVHSAVMKSLGKFPDPFLAEICGAARCPAARRRVGLRGPTPRPSTRSRGRPTGRHVVFTGMGSSYDACYPGRERARRAGIVATACSTRPSSCTSARRSSTRDALLVAGQPVGRERRGGANCSTGSAPAPRRRSWSPSRTELENSLAERPTMCSTRMPVSETGPSTMTFAAFAGLGRRPWARADRRRSRNRDRPARPRGRARRGSDRTPAGRTPSRRGARRLVRRSRHRRDPRRAGRHVRPPRWARSP